MISWLTGTRLYGWIAGGVVFLLGALALYLKGRSAGKEVVREEVQKRDVEEAKQHAETIREVADAQSNVIRLDGDAVRKRLSERWTRKAD